MGDAFSLASSNNNNSVVVIDEDKTGMETETKTKTSDNIFLQIVEHPDGSVTRPDLPTVPPTDDPNSPVLYKDIPLDPNLGTKLRLYIPNDSIKDDEDDDDDDEKREKKKKKKKKKQLPIIIYYHGGGFVLLSPDFVLYHQFCHSMAAGLPALVVSLDYRLAPENRLPAAYDDAVDAILWVRRSTDPWIVDHGDLSRCFVIGSSSGGNMAYFASLRAAKLELDPVKLRGVVMIQPYFGGEERTRSEMESEEDGILPLRANEMMWRMALPEGADRDHRYCNPMKNELSAAEDEIALLLLPKTMVMGCRGDPLFDRQKMFVEMLALANARVVDRLEEKNNGYHSKELFDPAEAEAVISEIKEFVLHASSV